MNFYTIILLYREAKQSLDESPAHEVSAVYLLLLALLLTTTYYIIRPFLPATSAAWFDMLSNIEIEDLKTPSDRFPHPGGYPTDHGAEFPCLSPPPTPPIRTPSTPSATPTTNGSQYNQEAATGLRPILCQTQAVTRAESTLAQSKALRGDSEVRLGRYLVVSPAVSESSIVPPRPGDSSPQNEVERLISGEDNQEREREFGALKNENEQLRQQLQKINEREQDVEVKLNQLNEWAAGVTEREKTVLEREKEHQDGSLQMSEMYESIKNRHCEVLLKEQEVQKLFDDLERQQATTRPVELQATKTTEEDNAVQELKAKVQEQDNKLQQQEHQLRAYQTQAQAELSGYKTQIKQMEDDFTAKITLTAAEMTRCQSELHSIQRATANQNGGEAAEASILRTALADRDQEFKTLSEKNTAFASTVINMKEVINRLDNVSAQKDAHFEKLDNEMAQKNADIAQLKEYIEAMKNVKVEDKIVDSDFNTLKQQMEHTKVRMESEISFLKNGSMEQHKHYKQLRKDYEQSQHDLRWHEARVKELETEVATTVEIHPESKARYQQEVIRLNAVQAKLESELNYLKSSGGSVATNTEQVIANLKKELLKESIERVKAQDRYQQVLGQVATVNKELEQYKNGRPGEVQQKKYEVAKLRAQVDSLKNEMQIMAKHHKESKASDAAQVKTAMAKLTQEYENHVHALNESSIAQADVISGLEIELGKLDEEKSSLEWLNSHKDEELSKKDQTIHDLQAQQVQHDNHLEGMRMGFETTRSMLNAKIATLQAALAQNPGTQPQTHTQPRQGGQKRTQETFNDDVDDSDSDTDSEVDFIVDERKIKKLPNPRSTGSTQRLSVNPFAQMQHPIPAQVTVTDEGRSKRVAARNEQDSLDELFEGPSVDLEAARAQDEQNARDEADLVEELEREMDIGYQG